MKIKKLKEMLYSDSVEEERIVNDIIKKLEEIDVDVETMQNILEKIGMDDQMLSQLVRSYPKHAIRELIYLDTDFVSEDIDEFLLNLISEQPEFRKKLSELLIKLDANKYNI